MDYWRINTDRDARKDIRTCDLWYDKRKAFTGDFEKSRTTRPHYRLFERLSPGVGLFMHHSGLGIVGYGVVEEEWDGKIYKGKQRRLYKVEPYEYRIAVKWDSDYDCRENPVSILGTLPYAGTYSRVDPEKWDIKGVLRQLRERAV